MTKCLGGSGTAGAPRRIDGRQRTEEERHAADAQYVQSLHVGRKIAHVVDPRIEELSIEQPLEPADERLQIVRNQGAEPGSECRPGEADDDALNREDGK